MTQDEKWLLQEKETRSLGRFKVRWGAVSTADSMDCTPYLQRTSPSEVADHISITELTTNTAFSGAVVAQPLGSWCDWRLVSGLTPW